MALTNTTLAVAVTNPAGLRVKLTSATAIAVGDIVKINDEYMIVNAIGDTPWIDVRGRGSYGTRAKAHAILSPVTFGPQADFAPYEFDYEGEGSEQIAIGADGVITLPERKNVVVIMNKATALATTTLADPSDAQDGQTVKLICGTNAAHVVTFTTLHDGTTGVHTTATFAAFIGASLTVRANAGHWDVLANNACTIS